MALRAVNQIAVLDHETESNIRLLRTTFSLSSVSLGPWFVHAFARCSSRIPGRFLVSQYILILVCRDYCVVLLPSSRLPRRSARTISGCCSSCLVHMWGMNFKLTAVLMRLGKGSHQKKFQAGQVPDGILQSGLLLGGFRHHFGQWRIRHRFCICYHPSRIPQGCRVAERESFVGTRIRRQLPSSSHLLRWASARFPSIMYETLDSCSTSTEDTDPILCASDTMLPSLCHSLRNVPRRLCHLTVL